MVVNLSVLKDATGCIVGFKVESPGGRENLAKWR